MKILFSFYIFFACFVAFVATAAAGPFGTNMNDPIDNFKDITEFSTTAFPGNVYITDKLPKRHSAFSKYLLIFGSDGLCGVGAITKNFDNDRSGSEAKAKYNELKMQLTEKYGTPTSIEYLKPGALWKNDNEFLSSLFYKERSHMCEWTVKVIVNIDKIYLMLNADSQYRSNISVIYLYKNFEELKKNATEKEKNAL